MAEIESKNIPAILIPYPFADGHQRENARVFSRRGTATVVEQGDLTPELLAGLIEKMFLKIENSDFAGAAAPAKNARLATLDFLMECVQK